ncbi:MAG: hypothetical protein WC295_00430, partial [Methanoregula sp.]
MKKSMVKNQGTAHNQPGPLTGYETEKSFQCDGMRGISRLGSRVRLWDKSKTPGHQDMVMGIFETISDEAIKRGDCTDIYFVRTEE